MSKTVLVRKASGELEAYDPNKLAISLRSAGADEELVDHILANIAENLIDGITTKKIYARALSLLGRYRRASRARYRIKDALMELGNTGYPFEIFIGQLFKKLGYAVQVGQVVNGLVITHEIDVIANGKDRQYLLECKYTQKEDGHVSIQVPLYFHSRFNDIVAIRQKDVAFSNIQFIGGIATNTRFSSDSTKYAEYYGLRLLSWDYPHGAALRDLVDAHRLYPVTVLSTISSGIKNRLIDQGLITCFQLLEDMAALQRLGLGHRKTREVGYELEAIFK